MCSPDPRSCLDLRSVCVRAWDECLRAPTNELRDLRQERVVNGHRRIFFRNSTINTANPKHLESRIYKCIAFFKHAYELEDYYIDHNSCRLAKKTLGDKHVPVAIYAVPCVRRGLSQFIDVWRLATGASLRRLRSFAAELKPIAEPPPHAKLHTSTQTVLTTCPQRSPTRRHAVSTATYGARSEGSFRHTCSKETGAYLRW